MAAAKGTPGLTGDRNPLRMVLFILSIGLCFLCFYLILDFQGSAQSKLSGELILGQVDSASYNHKDAPILGFFFEYFGVLTYLFAAMIIYLGYFLVLKPIDIWHADFYKGCLRLLGFNCTLLGLAGVLSRYFDIGFTGAGGLLGDMLNMFCDLALPSFLSVFIFAVTVFCGVSMLFGKNPFFIFDKVGDLFFKVLPAKSNTNGKKHATHHLTQDDGDLALSKTALGVTAATSALVGTSQAQAQSNDFAQFENPEQNNPQSLDGYNEDRDFNTFNQADGQNAQDSNLNKMLLPNENSELVKTNEDYQSAVTPEENHQDFNLDSKESVNQPVDFFAQVMSSEYGRMSPNDQAFANENTLQIADYDQQQAEIIKSNEQNITNDNALDEAIAKSNLAASDESYLNGDLSENEQDGNNMPSTNEDFAPTLSQDFAQHNNQDNDNYFMQDEAKIKNNEALQEENNSNANLEPNYSFISPENSAAQQIFANEMQSEDDSSFTNVLAGLDTQEDLSQVPPMPNINNSQPSDFEASNIATTASTTTDTTAAVNEQNAIENSSYDNVVQDDLQEQNLSYEDSQANASDSGNQDLGLNNIGVPRQFANEVTSSYEQDNFNQAVDLNSINDNTQNANEHSDIKLNDIQSSDQNLASAKTSDLDKTSDNNELDSKVSSNQVSSNQVSPVDSNNIQNNESSLDDSQLEQANANDQGEQNVNALDALISTQESTAINVNDSATLIKALDTVATSQNNTTQELADKAQADEYVNSPYGYGSYAAKHSLVPRVSLDDNLSKDSSNDNDGEQAVHTIVQRTDPKVIAAQIAAQNKEKEERERKKREEQERKEREAIERRVKEERERKEREEQERKEREERELKERESQLQAQNQLAEHSKLNEQDSSISNSDNNELDLNDEEYEYVYEEDDETPIYAGTYAARLAREKAAQSGKPLNNRRLKKIKRDTGEEVIDLATPNTHDIGVNLPLEERPRTIIRDNRNDEDSNASTNNYYPKVKLPEDNDNDVQAKSSLDQDSASNNVQNTENDSKSNLTLDYQDTNKNELIETLSSLASEMDDAKLQQLNEDKLYNNNQGYSQDSIEPSNSFNFDKLDKVQISSTEDIKADNSKDIASEDTVSTNIQVGSGSPSPQSQQFNQGNVSTNITRATTMDATVDQDNDFYRFATTRDNELQANQAATNNSVDVNLLNDEFEAPYVPKHVYDFGGNQVGKIDESLSGVEGGTDDEFVTGAAIEDKGLPGNGGFDFARFVNSSSSDNNSNVNDTNHLGTSEKDKNNSESEDNIISFDKPKQSYEIGSLSSAFIPMEDESDHSLNSKSSSLFGDHDYVHDSYENKVKERLKDQAQELMDSPDTVHNMDETNSSESDQSQDNSQYDYQLDSNEEQNNQNEEYQASSLDQSMMANQMEAFNNTQMINNQAMYNQMANQMPNGQQVQYMQLPNGQYVPILPNAMNNMAPNMMYPNMQNPNMGMGQVQYMQLPNGQYVPLLPNAMNNMAPNMIYQNMAASNMGMVGNMPMVNNQVAPMMPNAFDQANNGESNLNLQDSTSANAFTNVQVDNMTNEANSLPEQAQSTIGMPSAGNAFMGAHNSSSSNLPSYMAGVSQVSDHSGNNERSSLALCSVPKRRYDSWRPPLDLLARSNSHVDISLDELNKTSERINDVLHSFGVKATVADYLTGPVITRFDLDLAPGVKSTAISSIETELCRNLMVPNVRVVPIVEGSSYVGLEVPNPQRQFITLADMASSRDFQESKASLPMCLGASVVGAPVVKDLSECPHLLVAGTTGSGKSAGLNTMLISLLLKRSPSELRLILVDPKQLEFSIYKDLPHLITPVITDVAEKTPIALRWCVDEMERRFRLMSMLGVRKLSEYNDLIKSKAANGQSIADPLWNKDLSPNPQALEPLPWIVVVVEEFADLMAQSSRKKDKDSTPDGLIARLSAKSRAAGIHLVLVTQTPRSEVVTGMIKANFPSRVAFTVQNRLDSTIVLDEKGAECLLGNGDMLYKFPGEGTATRAHGSFTSNDDVKAVVDAWKEYAGAPEYLEDVVAVQEEESEEPLDNKAKELDVKFDQAVEVVREYMDRRNKPPTVTDLQTELGVGYPRAKKIFMQLSREGIID